MGNISLTNFKNSLRKKKNNNKRRRRKKEKKIMTKVPECLDGPALQIINYYITKKKILKGIDGFYRNP